MTLFTLIFRPDRWFRSYKRIMKHPNPHYYTEVIAVCLIFLQSCELLQLPLAVTERTEIRLPSPHPVLSLAAPGTIPSYTLRWYDGEGSRMERKGVTGPVMIELETGILTPVLLIPETGDDVPGILPCAGALYPVDAERGGSGIILETGWLKGIAAGLAEEICLSSTEGFETGRNIAAHFNWMRFAEKLALVPDPLALDRERIREAVLSGAVTVYDITEEEKITVRCTIPDGTIPQDAPFIPAWPGGEGFRWPASNELELAVPEGQTCFFGEKGVVVFQVEKGKQVCAFYRPYSLQD